MYPHSKHKCSHKYIDEHSPCRVLGSSVSHLFHRGGGQTLKQKILQAFYSNHLKAMVKRKCSQTINSEWATWRTPSPSDRCIPKSVQEWNHGPLSDVRIKERGLYLTSPLGGAGRGWTLYHQGSPDFPLCQGRGSAAHQLFSSLLKEPWPWAV